MVYWLIQEPHREPYMSDGYDSIEELVEAEDLNVEEMGEAVIIEVHLDDTVSAGWLKEAL